MCSVVKKANVVAATFRSIRCRTGRTGEGWWLCKSVGMLGYASVGVGDDKGALWWIELDSVTNVPGVHFRPTKRGS